MILYYIGCAALGVTTGFLVGGSGSPVVQYVLPFLFALIGGAAGVFALRATPSTKSAENRFRVVGLTTVCLTLPFFSSMLYGSMLRTGSSLRQLIPPIFPAAQEIVLSDDAVRSLPPEDSMIILLASNDLSMIGVSDRDRNLVINQMINYRVRSLKALPGIKRDITVAARRFVKMLDKYRGQLASNSDIDKWREETSLFISAISGSGNDNHRSESLSAQSLKSVLSDSSTLSTESIDLLNSNPDLVEIIGRMQDLLGRFPAADVLSAEVRSELSNSSRTETLRASASGNAPPLARDDSLIPIPEGRS